MKKEKYLKRLRNLENKYKKALKNTSPNEVFTRMLLQSCLMKINECYRIICNIPAGLTDEEIESSFKEVDNYINYITRQY